MRFMSAIKFGASIPLIDRNIIASRYPSMNIVIIRTDCFMKH